jgi:hypothetical protein
MHAEMLVNTNVWQKMDATSDCQAARFLKWSYSKRSDVPLKYQLISSELRLDKMKIVYRNYTQITMVGMYCTTNFEDNL